MSVLLKLIYRFNATPNKIQAGFFVDINKLILKFIQKGKGTQMAKKKQGWEIHTTLIMIA